MPHERLCASSTIQYLGLRTKNVITKPVKNVVITADPRQSVPHCVKLEQRLQGPQQVIP